MKLLPLLIPALLGAQSYDVVIANGRVIDPETALDAVRHVGITAGRIEAVSPTPLTGRRVIDAAGLVVAPGFIDLHSHGQDIENDRYKAADGVTTALELEIGVADIGAWYAKQAGQRMVHYGASAGHVPHRMAVMRDPSKSLVPSGDAAHRAATGEEITAVERRLAKDLGEGSVGVGFGLQYTPAASREEIVTMFRVAGARRAPAFVHMRHMGGMEPASALAGLQELIACSAISGAPVHVVHITSSGLRQTPVLLDAIGAARRQGIDISTECYPYTAAQTALESAIFDGDWRKVLGIDYGGVEWVATGERLTAETFARYRKQGGMAIMHMIPDEVVRLAVASPLTMIASDGHTVGGKGHPRGAGTFTRLLGYYSREQAVLPLPEAIRKITLMPAQRLEAYVPQMKRKGRIQAGADADVTVFDAGTVIDRATFREPTLPPAGVRHVLVAGTAVVSEGRLVAAARPGQAVRRAPD